jgi:hypothetical protein
MYSALVHIYIILMLAELFNKRNKKEVKELSQLFNEPVTKVREPIVKPRQELDVEHTMQDE